jgi:diguanylate cyclase (GGDEF)-like protein
LRKFAPFDDQADSLSDSAAGRRRRVVVGGLYLAVSIAAALLAWESLSNLTQELYDIFNRSTEDTLRTMDLTLYYMGEVRSYLKTPDGLLPEGLLRRLAILRERRGVILSSTRFDHLDPAFQAFLIQRLETFAAALDRLAEVLRSGPLDAEGVFRAEQLMFRVEDTISEIFTRNDAYIKDTANQTLTTILRIFSVFVAFLFFLMLSIGALAHLWTKTRRQQRMLHRQAVTDALTGLYNRRHFDGVGGALLANAARGVSGLSLIALDVDHFKRYNDTYGHDQGDMALILVARTIRACLTRRGDIAFRLGGEEFGCLVATRNPRDAHDLAECIRAQVEAAALPHRSSSVAPVLTVSLGVAAATHARTETLNDLYVRADQALYRAKSAGRNRVVDADENLERQREPATDGVGLLSD